MSPEPSIGEIFQRVLGRIALVEMTETSDGRKYALRVQHGDCERFLLLYKRAVARILEGRCSVERLRDLVGAELLAQEFRRSG